MGDLDEITRTKLTSALGEVAVLVRPEIYLKLRPLLEMLGADAIETSARRLMSFT